MTALLGQVAVAKNKAMSQVLLQVSQAVGADTEGLTLSYVSETREDGSPTLTKLPQGEDVILADTCLKDGGVVVLGQDFTGYQYDIRLFKNWPVAKK